MFKKLDMSVLMKFSLSAMVRISKKGGASSSMGIVSVANLKKAYGTTLTVNDVSFQIRHGEILGFLGPNGGRKNAIINMLVGLSGPTSGHIVIDGIDAVKDIKKAQRIMGIVPDESNLYDEMDGFDNLCFYASLYGMRKEE